jgi:hypothetical protein
MDAVVDRTELTVTRRMFAAWSIEIPGSFAETFVREDSYWHAYDAHRSVSLTSLTLTDKGRAVSPDLIARQIPVMDGEAVDALPSGLLGQAVTADAPQPARASRMFSGMLAAEGRLLIVTITSDDLDWALRIWLSIRTYPAQPPGVTGRPGRARARQRIN